MSECVVKQLISRTDSLRNIIIIVVLHEYVSTSFKFCGLL